MIQVQSSLSSPSTFYPSAATSTLHTFSNCVLGNGKVSTPWLKGSERLQDPHLEWSWSYQQRSSAQPQAYYGEILIGMSTCPCLLEYFKGIIQIKRGLAQPFYIPGRMGVHPHSFLNKCQCYIRPVSPHAKLQEELLQDIQSIKWLWALGMEWDHLSQHNAFLLCLYAKYPTRRLDIDEQFLAKPLGRKLRLKSPEKSILKT